MTLPGTLSVRTAADLLSDPTTLRSLIAAYGAGQGTTRLPVASALAFKAYTWLPIDLAVGRWAAERRVIDVSASRVTLTGGVVGAAAGDLSLEVLDERLTVLPDDPLAGQPGVTVVADDDALLAVLGRTLIDGHLAPAVAAFQGVRGGGARPLWGTVAQSLGYPVANASAGQVPDRIGGIQRLLSLLPPGVADLVEVAEADEGAGWRPILLRRTCCYAYTLPAAQKCLTCCLLTDLARAELAAEQGTVVRRLASTPPEE